ncbi:MAG: SDR family NAD(P)-dependent oxidoreductase [Bifidobacteriaceae bacterium]|jgi:NAD(P)-dependent dehydrogenase (short-subunit alcohol dehydrogenase family)/rhamnose utilization protein RhaD (predicted bifunctional aldolase and dehydrogenase)|nr:SDR family NAD(P)-dependent oxidoreductase [Bifidobacteriaceae bacterium]
MNLAEQAIALAHRFGGDPEFTRAGGGNVSHKQDGVLHIKPSGVPMSHLEVEDLVPLRIDVLLSALHADEPAEGDPVRAAANKAVIGQPSRRPSVEILFHALIADELVFHAHPIVANALTCHADGPALAAQLFGDQAVFVPYQDPGLPLARAIEAARAAHSARTGAPPPAITFLGNHGVVVSGPTADAVGERIEHLTSTIRAALGPEPAHGPPVPADAAIAVVAPTLRGTLAKGGRAPVVTSDASAFAQGATLAPAGAAVLVGGPLIPDQIVYAGSLPCVIPPGDDLAAATADAVARFREQHGRDPIIAVIPGLAVFGAGPDLGGAQTALGTFTDALRMASGAVRLSAAVERSGAAPGAPPPARGLEAAAPEPSPAVKPMSLAERSFIENWEAESYRQKVAAGGQAGRLAGKVVVVTGAAQGFGLGLVEASLAEGATVVMADLNEALAKQNADRLNAQHGPGRATALAVDVADEQSQLAAAAAVTALLGGLDVFISNAGVLRAASVFDQTVADFDLVTGVNYRGYFLGVRAVSPIMARQHAANPGLWGDIIEINSKSGLEGSKRNFSYSGSKFGGIGLTQSFALELAEVGIKVNAICPGNYLDGPLWSDPDTGLFVQYLRTGKVPGATTVDDVRRFYEAKVPIGRGCQPADVAKAVFYLVDQAYETGQAVPVTGGQNMLS